MENLLDKTTQLWVKLTGRRIDPQSHSWLMGPVGDADKIGDKFIARLAQDSNLKIVYNEKGSGLLNRIEELHLSDAEMRKLNSEVADFYVRTSSYDFEVWSNWCGFFRPFGTLLSLLFSKRLQQLNLPLNPMDSSRGLQSNIVKLKRENENVWTVWYRTLKSNKRVIYSGVYTTCSTGFVSDRLLKVIFPLPNGNAMVIMTRRVLDDGSLLFSSDGTGFGHQGFYFTLTDHKGKYWAKYVRAMHEWIHVYVDDVGVLRADHNLNFYGMRFLDLHYKMTPKREVPP